MKKDGYQQRSYRQWSYSRRLFTCQLVLKETDLHIMTDGLLDSAYALKRIARYRDQIEEYLRYKDRRFLTALKPLPVESTAPPIVRDMAEKARRAGVGPMAAVAGAIARYLGRDLLDRGYEDVVVENGGDIFLKVRRPITVGLFAGSSAFSGRLRMRISPRQMPLGVCTSSGTVGHSVSFGTCDSATVLARSAVLADAAATAVANRVRADADFSGAIACARSIAGVQAAVIVKGNRCAVWGEVRFI